MEPFKNVFSPDMVACFGDHLERRVEGFDRHGFESPVLAELESLELKARAQLIADHLDEALPPDRVERFAILADMVHPDESAATDQTSDADGLRGWAIMPMTMAVAQADLSDAATFDAGLALLALMTTRFTSEFAIRSFLLADQDRALATLEQWVGHDHEGVRRLVSEGSRPRLPWAPQLPASSPTHRRSSRYSLAYATTSPEYVRRSVANHLNDIAKDHPDLVAEIATEWMAGASRDRERLIRHGCRTLIKQGHPEALAAFGFGPPELDLTTLAIDTPTVTFGEALEFRAEITSTAGHDQELAVDYVVFHQKANGNLAPKVFKWKTLTLAAGDTVKIDRTHAMRPITTRKYYPGEHRLALRINGADYGDAEFALHM